jgi:hypothetical protein
MERTAMPRKGQQGLSSLFQFTSFLFISLLGLEAGAFASYPVISNLKVSYIYTHSAIISWSTDIPSTTQVSYGLSTSYTHSTGTNYSKTTYHQVNLKNLFPGKLYHFRAVSMDPAALKTSTPDTSFSTKSLTIPTYSWSLTTTPLDWQIAWTGYGHVTFDAVKGIDMAPQRLPYGSMDTTSSLLLSKRAITTPVRDFQLTMVVSTDEQLRSPTPNPWEVFWVFFNWTYDPSTGKKRSNYYYLGTRGSELGTAYAELGQSFLQTNRAPVISIGSLYTIQLTKIRNQVFVSINGQPAISYTGASAITKSPTGELTGWGLYDIPGTIGLYNEDARVHIYSAKLTPISYN